MTEPLQLARKYRPGRFADVAGQRPSVAVLYRMARRGTVPGALLLYGERGCGKTSTARILAKALNCLSEPGTASEWPCGTCASCEAVAEGISPDVTEVDAASNGTVDQVRKLISQANYETGGRYKVIILDEAHQLSGAAFDALLKTLEETPPNVVFILLTTRPGVIPVTIVSRCSQFAFAPLPAAVIAERLGFICKAEGVQAEPALLEAIAASTGGGMRDAINRLDQVASVGITSLDMWRELTGETDFAPALLTAAAAGDHAALFQVLDTALAANGDTTHVVREVIRCLRDLLVLGEGAAITAQGAALEIRRTLAGKLSAARVVAAMQVLWDLQAKVHVEDREAGLTLAVVMVSRRLCAASLPDAATIEPGGGTKTSLSELRSIFGGNPVGQT